MDVNNQEQQHEHRQPMLIPIHSDSEIPEWAMIEVNGELIAPKECPDGKENPKGPESLVERNRLELGSLRFVDEVGTVCQYGTIIVSKSSTRSCASNLIRNCLSFLIAETSFDHGITRAHRQTRKAETNILRLAETSSRWGQRLVSSHRSRDAQAAVQSVPQNYHAIKVSHRSKRFTIRGR